MTKTKTKRLTVSDEDYFYILGLKSKYTTNSIRECINHLVSDQKGIWEVATPDPHPYCPDILPTTTPDPSSTSAHTTASKVLSLNGRKLAGEVPSVDARKRGREVDPYISGDTEGW